MIQSLKVSSLLLLLFASCVWAQMPSEVSSPLEVPEAAPLRPPKPYDPSLTPRVDFLVVASLPGNVPCSDLSDDDLEQLAIGFCGNLGKLANLSSFWFPETCNAECAPSSGRRLLQVNPIIFNQDCVRATEDPEDVTQANIEAMELEEEALDNNLLQNSLEATLPGTTVLEEKVTPSYVDDSSQESDAEEKEEDGCYFNGIMHPPGLYVYSQDPKKGFCQCCQGELKNCKQRLTGKEETSCQINETFGEDEPNKTSPGADTFEEIMLPSSDDEIAQLENGGSSAGVAPQVDLPPAKRPVETSTNYPIQYPENQKGNFERCNIDGVWYPHGLFVYCKDCTYNFCRCCNGGWTQCTNALTGKEPPTC